MSANVAKRREKWISLRARIAVIAESGVACMNKPADSLNVLHDGTNCYEPPSAINAPELPSWRRLQRRIACKQLSRCRTSGRVKWERVIVFLAVRTKILPQRMRRRRPMEGRMRRLRKAPRRGMVNLYSSPWNRGGAKEKKMWWIPLP